MLIELPVVSFDKPIPTRLQGTCEPRLTYG